MATTSDIRNGLCIKYNHDIYKIIDPNLSIDENSIFEVKIFPNPATNQFTIQTTNSQIIEIINIYNCIKSTRITICNYQLIY